MDSAVVLRILDTWLAVPACRLLQEHTSLFFEREERTRIPQFSNGEERICSHIVAYNILLETVPAFLRSLCGKSGEDDTQIPEIHKHRIFKIRHEYSAIITRRIPQRQPATDEIHQYTHLQFKSDYTVYSTAHQSIVDIYLF